MQTLLLTKFSCRSSSTILENCASSFMMIRSFIFETRFWSEYLLFLYAQIVLLCFPHNLPSWSTLDHLLAERSKYFLQFISFFPEEETSSTFFLSLSPIAGNMVVPLDKTMLLYRSFLTSTSDFIMLWKVNWWILAKSFPILVVNAFISTSKSLATSTDVFFDIPHNITIICRGEILAAERAARKRKTFRPEI